MSTIETELPTNNGFDSAEAGKQVALQTAILELHISRPGFRKAINSTHFMKVLNSLSEDEIANLSPEMKSTIEQFRSGALISNGNGEDKPDPTMFHVSQDLIDSKAIKAITKHDNRFTGWIKNQAVRSPLKFQGAYLMRLCGKSTHEAGCVCNAEAIDAAIQAYSDRREELVELFSQRWFAAIEDAKTRRGPFFDSADYPSFESIRSEYCTEHRWLSVNVPAAFEKMKSEIWKRESEKAKVFFQDAAQEARAAAREAFSGLTDHLLAQLGNDESGKPKRFMGSSLKKMVEFIDMICGGGDLTGDDELKSIAMKAKEVLSGVSGEDVRKQEGLRSSLHTAVEAIKTEAAKLVTVSQRKFALDDYEDEPAALSID